MIVNIGEDATRIIFKVQYDCNTNKIVGFVLPCDELGLPLIDSFLAISFEQMEQCFADLSSVVKNCFVYMAQPLLANIPAYCLACFGINNKHDLYFGNEKVVLYCVGMCKAQHYSCEFWS